ncbi:MAG: hypothetical protein JSS34_02345 [Proteobacteria bacterium]|nr:hypothetical protein [Pseudomonadota bacterium]
MKYSFKNKASFIALCAAALLPCYLNVVAGGGPNGEDVEQRPSRATPPSSIREHEASIPPVAHFAPAISADDESAPPPYAVAAAMAVSEAAAASSKDEKKSKGDEDDDDDADIRILRDQLLAQELATKDAVEKANRQAALKAKKESLLAKIRELKAQEEAAIQAANGAAEARSEAQAADAEDPVPGLEAAVNAHRAAIAHLEDEADAVEDEIAVAQGREPAPKSAQERRWDNFSAKWSKKKADAFAETGDSKLQDHERVQREAERVFNQVRDGVEKLFGKKKKKK